MENENLQHYAERIREFWRKHLMNIDRNLLITYIDAAEAQQLANELGYQQPTEVKLFEAGFLAPFSTRTMGNYLVYLTEVRSFVRSTKRLPDTLEAVMTDKDAADLVAELEAALRKARKQQKRIARRSYALMNKVTLAEALCTKLCAWLASVDFSAATNPVIINKVDLGHDYQLENLEFALDTQGTTRDGMHFYFDFKGFEIFGQPKPVENSIPAINHAFRELILKELRTHIRHNQRYMFNTWVSNRP